METKHEWAIGDLCTCTYGGTGHGVIYRVIAKMPGHFGAQEGMLHIAPAHGVMAKTERRGKRKIGAGWCKPLTLVDLGTEYVRFGLFIQEEAKRRGAAADPQD